uniref:Arginyl-tRNA--protein transferase 1 n=1 Tax=Schistosoma mansoni TaxID=6183 RepID=A0A3Q0KL67_SCHMA
MKLCTNPSLVIPYGPHSSGQCGYCKNSSDDKKTNWGMMAERLTVSDYQYMIDRGWRRSGTYCYKPLNDITCCPSYTIRCDALQFHLKKSHKRVLKNMYNFLKFGQLPHRKMSHPKEDPNNLRIDDHRIFVSEEKAPPVLSFKNVIAVQQNEEKTKNQTNIYQTDCFSDKVSSSSTKNAPSTSHTLNTPNNNDDNNVEFQSISSSNRIQSSSSYGSHKMKAHLRRWLAKQEHLRHRSLKENRSFEILLQEYYERRQKRLDKNKPKQIEDFLQSEPNKGEGKHFIEIRLIRTSSPTDIDYESRIKLSHKIYEQYQIHIHNDDKEDCTWERFQRFLVKSPLVLDDFEWNSTSPMFGSYHQQYWLDGEKLIAVGVIDLLPRCLSSVYVFYDPNYSFLHLGTYTALREIAYVRHLSKLYSSNNSIQSDILYSNFNSYYMGYYIHNCRKMSYKSHYTPAYLACPITYHWIPINDCLHILNQFNSIHSIIRFSSFTTMDNNSIPDTIDIDILDSNIYFYIKDNHNNKKSSSSRRSSSSSTSSSLTSSSTTTIYTKEDFIQTTPISLYNLRSYLNKHAIPIFREWAKLLGKRVLSGHFQIIISSS